MRGVWKRRRPQGQELGGARGAPFVVIVFSQFGGILVLDVGACPGDVGHVVYCKVVALFAAGFVVGGNLRGR